MPNAQNQAMMESIKADLADVTAVWAVDYRGLTVKEVEQLRRDIRESGSIMKVYKNTLMRIALKDLDMPAMDEVLAGPTAFVFCGDDPVAPARALKKFAKDNENLTIKGGIMDGQSYNADQVMAIAELATREEMMAQIASMISGVARGLAVAINEIPSGLARAINAAAQEKPAA